MELREPPRPTPTPASDRPTRLLLLLNLALVAAIAAASWLRPVGAAGASGPAELDREVASKLKAAGAFDEAAALLERHLEAGHESPEARAKIAYSLATTYLERGQAERALRWLYEAETLGAGELAPEVAQRIVHCLERLGRPHAAQAALGERVTLPGAGVARPEGDVVVAKVGEEEIHASDLDRALDELPPELARAFAEPDRRPELLRRVVAEKLLWRKARKLEYDRDPEVLRRHEALLQQLAIARFVEREVVAKVAVDEADLRNHFAANQARFTPPPAAGAATKEVRFEDVRQAVEGDYRRFKVQAAYEQLIDSELTTADVELYPERLGGGA